MNKPYIKNECNWTTRYTSNRAPNVASIVENFSLSKHTFPSKLNKKKIEISPKRPLNNVLNELYMKFESNWATRNTSNRAPKLALEEER